MINKKLNTTRKVKSALALLLSVVTVVMFMPFGTVTANAAAGDVVWRPTWASYKDVGDNFISIDKSDNCVSENEKMPNIFDAYDDSCFCYTMGGGTNTADNEGTIDVHYFSEAITVEAGKSYSLQWQYNSITILMADNTCIETSLKSKRTVSDDNESINIGLKRIEEDTKAYKTVVQGFTATESGTFYLDINLTASLHGSNYLIFFQDFKMTEENGVPEEAPIITEQPSVSTVLCNQTTPATVSIKASGDQLVYQWYAYDNDTSKFSDIKGAVNNSYTFNVSDKSSVCHTFYCIVTNSAGSVASEPVTWDYTHTYNTGTDNSDGTHSRTCSACGETETKSHVDENYDYVCDICGAKLDLTEIVSVSIEWGDLEFTYVDASEEWNPATHKYENKTDGEWVCAADSNKITVASESNVNLSVSFNYQKEEGITVDGSFTDGTNPITTALPLPRKAQEPGTVTVYLELNGKPDETSNNSVMGTVTVTLGR